MKTNLLLLLLLIAFSFTKTNAQCTEAATGFGNNISTPSYNVSGDVSITLNTNNTITLNLAANFMTASGPDIRPYLVKSNGATDAAINTAVHNQTIDNVEHIAFNSIISQNGMNSFTVSIPAGTSIENFDKILFYCLQYNQFWDIGSFTSFTASNCAALSIDENTLKSSFKTYPNPVHDILSIENNKQLALSASVFDVLGKKILQIKETNLSEIKINLSSLKAGVYLLQTKHKNATFTKRIIKQ